MYLGGKCKISWSNDDLERFYKSGHFEPPPVNLSRPRGPWQIGLINMFSNSKNSEIDLRGGGQHFSNKSEIQKSLKYPIGGKPIGDILPNFPVFKL